MKISAIFNSFRARLLLLLAVMLGLTLGVQYYVNLRAIKSNAQIIVEQEQAIMAGVALGVNSIFSTKYLDELSPGTAFREFSHLKCRTIGRQRKEACWPPVIEIF